MSKSKDFAPLPPQGYEFMTDLQRFDHKVRCAVLDVLRTGAGTWNVREALQQITASIGQPETKR